MVGAGQGLSYETISRDMSESNYSSARQGMIEDDLTYEEDKEQLLEIMDEIYESFVISLVLAGKVSISDFLGRKEGSLSVPQLDTGTEEVDRSAKRSKCK